jgi:chromosome segregation ATPase
MALRTENLSEEITNNLVNLQNELNELVFRLGQSNLQIRDLEKELNSAQDIKSATLQQYDMQLASFNRILSELDQQYPNGRVDLNAGTVEWEVQE